MVYNSFSAPDFPELAYRRSGSGPALVLIHGFPENGTLWQKIWTALSESFTLIIPDLPGSGISAYSGNEPFSVELMARSVQLMLEHAQITQAVFAGHSMGGYVALAFADLFPGYVKGVSLVHSSAYADTEEKKELRRKSIAIIRKGGKEIFVRQMVPNLFAPYTQKHFPERIEEQTQSSLTLPAESLVNFYNAMINRPDRTQLLTGAAFPVQWIIGKDDTAVPPQQGLQQSFLTNVNFVSVYNNCGHMSMIEHPDLLTRDLKEFTHYCFIS